MSKKIIVWPAFFSLLVLIGAKLPTQTPEVAYVGTETCLDCHDALLNRLLQTPHFAAAITEKHGKIESCEACHGPGGAHVEDPQAKGSIRNFTDMSAKESTEVCLSCHSSDEVLKNFQQEAHFQTGESCLICHAMHPERSRPKLLAQPAEKLCFSCHLGQEAEFNLPFHHKVKEGRMTCWDCHDPHETRVFLQSIGFKKIDERCYSCHPSQRGPFTYEHLGANAGTCRICHSPHGSENARLLRRFPQSQLCLECHSGPSPEQALLGSKTPLFHVSTSATYENCTVCHVKIHGSYLDSHFIR
ncbi:MAG: DmsE family decaheme c-type cytochrome [Candidatus Aminicenantales bacterium]